MPLGRVRRALVDRGRPAADRPKPKMRRKERQSSGAASPRRGGADAATGTRGQEITRPARAPLMAAAARRWRRRPADGYFIRATRSLSPRWSLSVEYALA